MTQKVSGLRNRIRLFVSLEEFYLLSGLKGISEEKVEILDNEELIESYF